MIKSLLRLILFTLVPLILLTSFTNSYNPLTLVSNTIIEKYYLQLFDSFLINIEGELTALSPSEQGVRFEEISDYFQSGLELKSIQSANLSVLEKYRLNKGNTILLYVEQNILARKLGKQDSVLMLRLDESEGEETYRQAIGPISLIANQLIQYPQESWADELEILTKITKFPVVLVGQDEFNVPNDLRLSYVKDNIHWYAYGDDEEIIYAALENSDQGLRIGPIATPQQTGLMTIFIISIISLVVLTTASGLMVWLWPLWKSLRSVKVSAEAFGKGDLTSRVNIKKSSIVSDLGHSFNDMADSIQKLIDTNQHLTNAVAHDLRTPLARLRFALEILESDNCSKEEASHYRDSVESSINSLDYLINQTLIHSRYNRVTDIRNFTSCDFANVLREEVEQYEFDHPDLSFEVAIDNALEGNQQFVDVNALKRALNNLLSNAVKYASSRIKVSYSADKNSTKKDPVVSLHLRVEDDGEGISSSDYDRVIKPFAQVENEARDSNLGHGLGLAIVHQIAKWHKGEILISESVLGGASIEIVWPQHKD